jgi:hypothetical protein
MRRELVIVAGSASDLMDTLHDLKRIFQVGIGELDSRAFVTAAFGNSGVWNRLRLTFHGHLLTDFG